MTKTTGSAARLAAAAAVGDVIDRGRSLDRALEQRLGELAAQERALASELAYGSLRYYSRLDAVASLLITRPLRPRDRDVFFLLLVGLYQCLELHTPDYAAVAATAGAARGLHKTWAVAVLNASLRRFLREREALLSKADGTDSARYSHPAWILERLRHDFPEHFQTVLIANNQRAPMTLRVNRRQGSRDAYLARLREAGLEAAAHPLAPDALVLEQAVAVERLPGFAAGAVSVQDTAPQLAAELLDVAAGDRVLDACAAPGGKTAHLLERYPDLGELLALDVDAQRLERVTQTLSRLGLRATVRSGDASAPAQWWDGSLFQRILLDAPCSGSGVIRRHPDIKWLRRPDDIQRLAATQRRLLDALWPLLARGGKLVYATCSTFDEENEAVVAGFVAATDDARCLPIDASWGLARGCGRQILAGEQGMDGFYYACLSKT